MPTYYPPGTRKGNKTFVVRGHIGGTQHEIKTNAGNKRAAEKAWQDFASDTRRDQRDANRTRETATFDWACDEYLKANPDLSYNYVLYIQKVKAHFMGWPLQDVTAESIYAASHVLQPNCKPQTKNSHVIIPCGSVLHYMARRKLCEHVVLSTFEPRDVQRPLTYPDELETLIAGATGELKAILMTFQIHGWRITETINIKTDRIDWKRGQIERYVSKSKERRRAAVDWPVLEAWRALPKREDGYLFSYRYRRAFYIAVDALIERLGLDMVYRPHRSRRGLVTAGRDLGFSIDDMQQAGQWKNRNSVLTYDRDNPERTRKVFEGIRGAIGGERKKA